MSNRRFDMYQYRQIIFRLRQGDTIRGIAQAKLAGRKKLRQIRDIAIQQGWLSLERNLPSDEELSSVFNLNSKYPKQSSAEPYRNQYAFGQIHEEVIEGLN